MAYSSLKPNTIYQEIPTRYPHLKEEDNMTKKMALTLLKGKGIYLTPEGKKMLKAILEGKNYVSTNGKV